MTAFFRHQFDKPVHFKISQCSWYIVAAAAGTRAAINMTGGDATINLSSSEV
jgi:hypothetical protein